MRTRWVLLSLVLVAVGFSGCMQQQPPAEAQNGAPAKDQAQATGAPAGEEHAGERRPMPIEGRNLYIAYCASCHGTDGKGRGPAAPALRGTLPDLTRIAARRRGEFPEERMRQIILGEGPALVAHGSTEMPVWGPVFGELDWDRDLRHVRVQNLVDYLKKMQD